MLSMYTGSSCRGIVDSFFGVTYRGSSSSLKQVIVVSHEGGREREDIDVMEGGREKILMLSTYTSPKAGDSCES